MLWEIAVLVIIRDGTYMFHSFASSSMILAFRSSLQDRILAFGTGRAVTIQEETIEVPLPSDEDMPPAPVLWSFVRFVRLFALAGRIANVMVSLSLGNTYRYETE